MCKTSSSSHKNQLNPENNATISSLAFDFSVSFLSLFFSIDYFFLLLLQHERLIFHFHTTHNTVLCLSVYKTLNCFSSPLFSSARESVFSYYTIHQWNQASDRLEPTLESCNTWKQAKLTFNIFFTYFSSLSHKFGAPKFDSFALRASKLGSM